YNQIVNEARETSKTLSEITKDDPAAHDFLEKATAMQDRDFEFLIKIKKIADTNARTFIVDQIRLVNKAREAVKDYAQIVLDFRHCEQEINQARSKPKSDVWTSRVEMAIVVSALCNILFTLLLAKLLSTSITKRLRHLSVNAKRLKDGQPLLPKLPGNDEIAQ